MFRNLFVAGAAFAGLSRGAALPAHTIEERQEFGACPPAPEQAWAPVNIATYPLGSYSCATEVGQGKNTYSPVSAITTWISGDQDHIAGIQFSFASSLNPTQKFGTADGDPIPVNFPPGALVTTAKIWTTDSDIASQFGSGWVLALSLTFNDGSMTTHHFGRDPNTLEDDPTFLNVGGGLLMGANVATMPRQDNGWLEIGFMQPLFYAQNITNVDIGYVNYDNSDPSSGLNLPAPDASTNGEWHNLQDTDVGYGWEGSLDWAQSSSYEQDSYNMYGVSVDVGFSADYMGIGVDESAGFTWSTSNEQVTSTSSSTAGGVTCTAAGTVPAHRGTKVQGNYALGKQTFIYQSQVNITFADNSSMVYTEHGKLTSSLSTNCNVTITNVPNGPNDPPDTNPVFPLTDSSSSSSTTTTSSSLSSSTIASTTSTSTSTGPTSSSAPPTTSSASLPSSSSVSSTISSTDSSTIASSTRSSSFSSSSSSSTDSTTTANLTSSSSSSSSSTSSSTDSTTTASSTITSSSSSSSFPISTTGTGSAVSAGFTTGPFAMNNGSSTIAASSGLSLSAMATGLSDSSKRILPPRPGRVPHKFF